MSADNDESRAQSRPEPAEPPDLDYDLPDDLLAFFVRLANSGTLEVGVTLSVGGGLVSGVLVGGRSWLVNVARLFETSGSDKREAGEVLGRALREWADDVYPERDEEDEELSHSTTTYIHLREAKVFHPGGEPIPGQEGAWWRGRLTAVEGFVFGQLSEPQPR